jgi:hypothetical protein
MRYLRPFAPLALLLLSPTISNSVALASEPISPLAPPVTIIIVDAPALPPELALRASADDVPTLEALDTADVRAGLPYTPPLSLEELLPSRFDVINPDPFRYAVVAIVVALPQNPGPAVSSRFDGKYWLAFAGWALLQIGDLITTWDAVAEGRGIEGNAAFADDLGHPNYPWLAGAKVGVGLASIIFKALDLEKSAYGFLLGGAIGSGVATASNTTIGK